MTYSTARGKANLWRCISLILCITLIASNIVAMVRFINDDNTTATILVIIALLIGALGGAMGLYSIAVDWRKKQT